MSFCRESRLAGAAILRQSCGTHCSNSLDVASSHIVVLIHSMITSHDQACVEGSDVCHWTASEWGFEGALRWT